MINPLLLSTDGGYGISVDDVSGLGCCLLTLPGELSSNTIAEERDFVPDMMHRRGGPGSLSCLSRSTLPEK